MTKPLTIHVGYHKTATTWMQKQLFQPIHGYRQLCGHAEVFKYIVQPHGLFFDAKPMQDLISRKLNDVQTGEAPIISSEILSGNPFFGGRESEIYANRLKAIAPEARILISIRHQLKVLPSVYMQYISRGGTMPAEEFFADGDVPGYFGFAKEHFEYDRLTEHYQKLFGVNNVYVITQESLKHSRDEYLSELATFCGNKRFDKLVASAKRPVGESYPEYAAPILRRINHVQKGILNPYPIVKLGTTPFGPYKVAGYVLKRWPFSTILRNQKPVTELVSKKFAGRYRDSNRRLADLISHRIELPDYEL